MISAFNSVYAALRGFFSQGFWFADFLPVALFAALHVVLAVAVIGPIGLLGVTISFQQVTGDPTVAGPAIIIALIVIGYALQPLVPYLQRLLDGSQFPLWLHLWLRSRRLAEAQKTRASLQESINDIGVLNDLRRDLYATNGRFRTAYRAALDRNDASDQALVDAASAAVNKLRDGLSLTEQLAPKAGAAIDAVIAALDANNPDPDRLQDAVRGPITVDQRQTAKNMGTVADKLEEPVSEAAREALYRRQILVARNPVIGALHATHATAVGDARFVAESYAKAVYNVEFEFLWPRLLVAVRAQKSDDPTLSTIEAARAQVEFAVLSLFLALSIPAVWLPVMLARGGPAWLFLVIGAATPVVLAFFYRVVFAAQLSFGRIIETTVDNSRLLVLQMLRQPEPVSRGDERRLWERIARAADDPRSTELIYTTGTPPPPAAGASSPSATS
jgi:hypothetical protein